MTLAIKLVIAGFFYWLFLASYVVAAIVTWTTYVRRPVCAPSVGGSALEAEPARV